MSASPSDVSRRRLAEAADVLAKFRDAAGVPAPPEAPSSAWRAPADASVRAALEDALARARDLESALSETARARAALEIENRRLAEAVERGSADAADAEALRARAAEAESRAAAQKARATLMEAEYVRLEAMRRKAERAAADAEASGRVVEETVRRELRATHAALDRAAAESGAAEGRAKTENEALRLRLESTVTRLQTLEREKRLELARGTGESSAIQTELLRTQAVAASLRQELTGARAQELDLRRQTTEAQAALAGLIAERPGGYERALAAEKDAQAVIAALRRELLDAEAVIAALRMERLDAQAAAAPLRRELSDAQEAAASLRRELSDARAAAAKRESERRDSIPPASASRVPPPAAAWEDDFTPPAEAAGEPVELPGFVQPPIEAVLDPGWARLLRLVRPPVEAAYAQLRRLSATALTTGQKALLKMGAASIAQASDSLASIELALEEGPAAGAPASAMPALESALAAWESAFRRGGVALARDWSGPVPEAVYDAKALRIMLFHVLRNVLEAVPRGGRLAVRAGSSPDGGLRLEFSDDGPGFSAEWLQHRFEPFASPRRGRAGLGLSLVRRTLRRWGGDAEASNGPTGRGARLTLLFPPAPPRQTE